MDDNLKKSILHKNPLEKIFQGFMNFLSIIAIRPKIIWEDPSMKKNLKGKPTVFICNHTNHLDGICIGSVLKKYKPYTIVTKKWYDKKGVGKMLQWARNIPIDLNAADADWFQLGKEVLEKNGSIIIFPEGGIAREGKMNKFKPGAALLSAHTGADIVPIASYGEYKLFFGKRQIIYIGKAIKSSCPKNVRYSKYSKALISQS